MATGTVQPIPTPTRQTSNEGYMYTDYFPSYASPTETRRNDDGGVASTNWRTEESAAFADHRSNAPDYYRGSPMGSSPCTPFDYIPSLERHFCSNFTCCNRVLPDMHQLLDHFEESHVMVIDPNGVPVYPDPSYPENRVHPPHPQFTGMTYGKAGLWVRPPSHLADSPTYQHQQQQPSLIISYNYPQTNSPQAYDSTPDSYSPSTTSSSPAIVSPTPRSPTSAPDPRTILAALPASPLPSLDTYNYATDDARNANEDYAPTAIPRDFAGDVNMQDVGLPPSLFTAGSTSGDYRSGVTPYGQASTWGVQVVPFEQQVASGKRAKRSYAPRRADQREKAYKCPRPGCIKAYLNPNGLKYHLEKGTCKMDPSAAAH